jgi:hypothetical protein
LEFLTHSYADRQASVQNQPATDAKAREYKEEYAKYEQELKEQQAKFVFYINFLILLVYFHLISYRRDHPDATTQLNEQQLV